MARMAFLPAISCCSNSSREKLGRSSRPNPRIPSTAERLESACKMVRGAIAYRRDTSASELEPESGLDSWRDPLSVIVDMLERVGQDGAERG